MLDHLSNSLIRKEEIIIGKVFVSYSRKNRDFAKALYSKLEDMGFDLWRDVHDIPADSHDWWQSIKTAIDNSHTMILLMSLPALKSAVVSDEWFYARQEGKRVIPVVADDIWEHPEVKDGSMAIPNWMQRRNWMDFRVGRAEADSAWANLINTLNSHYEPKRFINMVPQLPPNFVRRAEEIEGAVRALVNDNQDVIAMTTALRGAGGYGKTTLAKAIARDIRVRGAFDDGILFVTLGEELLKLNPEGLRNALIDRIRSLIVAIDGVSPNLDTLEIAQAKLAEAIGDRYILVLVDDVWDASHLEPFLVKGKHCTCLITTRDDATIRRNDIKKHIIDRMKPVEARELLGASFAEDWHEHQEELEKLAKGMRYYPLLLSLGNDQIVDYVRVQKMALGEAIKEAYNRLDALGALDFKEDSKQSRNRSVRLTLNVSLELLSPEHQNYYRQLAIFPEDAQIPLTTLAAYWNMKNIFLTETICETLYRRALLHSYEFRKIRIHDIFRDCIRLDFEAAQIKNLHERLLQAYQLPELPFSSGEAITLPDNYAWRNLSYHLKETEQLDYLKTLLLSFTYLETKLIQTDTNALIADAAYCLEERPIYLLHSALNMSSHILNEDTSQLASQLYGRLIGHKEDDIEITAFLEQIYDKNLSGLSLLPRHPTLEQAGGALIRRLIGHKDSITAVAVQGDFAISASSDGSLIVWNWQSGELIRKLKGDNRSATAVAVQGDFAISASDDRSLIVWNWQLGTQIRSLKGHSDKINSLAVQGDFAISASSDKSLIVWNWQSGELIHTLKGHSDKINSLAVQGDFAISASRDKSLIVWNWQSGELINKLIGHSLSVTAVAIQGDFAISASDDRSLIVWNWQLGTQIRSLKGHSDYVTALAVQGDFAISASWNESLRVWNWRSGTLIHQLIGHNYSVTTLAVQGDFAISASSDGSLIVWNWQSGTLIPGLTEHSTRITINALTVQGNFVISASDDESLKVWNWQSGELIRTFKGQDYNVSAFAVQGNFVISASDDESLKVWNWQSGELIRTFKGQGYRVTALAIQGDFAISASWNESLKVWNWQSGELIRTFKGQGHWVSALVIQGDFVISASDDESLKVWNWQSGELIHTLKKQGYRVTALAIQGDFVISASALDFGRQDHSLMVWNWQSGELIHTLNGHSDKINSLAVQGEFAISASNDRSLIVWNWRKAELLVKISMDAGQRVCAIGEGVIVSGDLRSNIHFFSANAALRRLLGWE